MILATVRDIARTRRTAAVHIGVVALWLVLRGATVHAQTGQPVDVGAMSLEELLDLKINAPTKTALRPIEVPQAVTVLTRAEIARIAPHNLPELLRAVVGVNIVRVQSSQNVLGARGSNAFTPSQVLILIDGQPISATLFSTTWWELVPIAIDDIERLEFIRSPGTIYGANAQHGVVNIVTIPESGGGRTHSVHVRTEAGQQGLQQHFAGYRGGAGGLAYRLSAELTRTDAYRNDERREIIPGRLSAAGEQRFVSDPRQLDVQQLGGALQRVSDGRRVALAAGVKHIARAQGRIPDRLCFVEIDGFTSFANAEYSLNSIRSRHTVSTGLDLARYDFVRNSDVEELAPAGARVTTLSLGYEWQQRVRRTHQLVTGVRYSVETATNVTGEPFFVAGVTDGRPTFTAHAQDEWRLYGSGRLYVGALAAHHYISGASIAPMLAFVHKLNERNVVRAATFTSYRNPNVFEHSMAYDQMTGATSKRTRLVSNPGLQPERTTSYELGVRLVPSSRALFSADVYLNDVGNGIEWSLVGSDATSTPRPHYRSENTLSQRVRGLELEVRLEPRRQWSFTNNLTLTAVSNTSSNAAYIGEDGSGPAGIGQGRFGEQYVPPVIYNAVLAATEGRFRGNLHYQYTGAHTWQWPAWNATTGRDGFDRKPVPGYGLLNAAAHWKLTSGVTVGVEAYNLLDNRHTEWRGDESYFGRAVSFRMEFDFPSGRTAPRKEASSAAPPPPPALALSPPIDFGERPGSEFPLPSSPPGWMRSSSCGS